MGVVLSELWAWPHWIDHNNIIIIACNIEKAGVAWERGYVHHGNLLEHIDIVVLSGPCPIYGTSLIHDHRGAALALIAESDILYGDVLYINIAIL